MAEARTGARLEASGSRAGAAGVDPGARRPAGPSPAAVRTGAVAGTAGCTPEGVHLKTTQTEHVTLVNLWTIFHLFSLFWILGDVCPGYLNFSTLRLPCLGWNHTRTKVWGTNYWCQNWQKRMPICCPNRSLSFCVGVIRGKKCPCINSK